MLGAAYYHFVYRPAHTVAVEAGYVLPPDVQMFDTPAEVRIVVGSLKSGDRVEITDRTRNWAHVRTADNVVGWVELKDLLDAQTYEGGQKLLRELLQIPVQAEGHTGGEVNLHLEPARDGAQLAQLAQGTKVEIYGRRLVDRTTPGSPSPSAKVRDAWYLIRAGATAGWLMGRFVDLDIPPALAPYAQNTNMVAWVVLSTVQDEGQAIPQYLAADREGTQEADFTHIRVFTWWIKNHKYVTAYVESNLDGYFPIRTSEIKGTPYFRIRMMDKQGHKFQKVYGLFDTMTRLVGTVQGWESNAMPGPRETHHRGRSGRRRG